MDFQPGQKVLVEAMIMHIYHADRDETWQTLGLQLTGDGQSLQTNVRNVRPADPEEDEGQAAGATEKRKAPAANKAKRPAANKGLSHSSFKAAAAASSKQETAGDAEDDEG